LFRRRPTMPPGKA